MRRLSDSGMNRNVIRFSEKPPLSLRDISPKGANRNKTSIVSPSLQGEGDGGGGLVNDIT